MKTVCICSVQTQHISRIHSIQLVKHIQMEPMDTCTLEKAYHECVPTFLFIQQVFINSLLTIIRIPLGEEWKHG